MAGWQEIAADPRSTDELFETALEELGSIDTPVIRDAMLACVEDDDSAAAGQALLNLAQLGDARIAEILPRYLEAFPDRYDGWEAATALAAPSMLPWLRATTPPSGYADEHAAAISACERREREERDVQILMTTSPDPDVEALVRHGSRYPIDLD